MKEKVFSVIEIVMIIVICSLLGFFVGLCKMQDADQKVAIKAGVAEYYLDTQNERQFRFKTLPNP